MRSAYMCFSDFVFLLSVKIIFMILSVSPSLVLNKNIVFPAPAEYSYFSTDFGLKLFLYCNS